MKKILLLIITLLFSFYSFAQKPDTVFIKPSDLIIKNFKPGNIKYVVFYKKAHGKPTERIMLVNI